MHSTKSYNHLMKNEIVIYQNKSGAIELKGDFKKETLWASQEQIAKLFEVDRSVATKHINNIFKDKEVDKESNVQKMHIPNSDKLVSFYSLDIILAVGYRTNSKKAIHFRIWASSILKKHLIQGYTINEKRLRAAQDHFAELQKTIAFLSEKSHKTLLKGQEAEILNLLQDYSKSLTFLERFDKNNLAEPKGKKTRFVLKYTEAKKILEQVKSELIAKKEATELFGQERDEAFAGIIGSIYQTFGGKDLYSNVELKAAHLLYFTIKDHPFTDGNKRSASFLFVYFLDKNNHLRKKDGERKINDNALTALALLVAESDPKEKEIMIRLITNLIA